MIVNKNIEILRSVSSSGINGPDIKNVGINIKEKDKTLLRLKFIIYL